jgi:hypothetical protein
MIEFARSACLSPPGGGSDNPPHAYGHYMTEPEHPEPRNHGDFWSQIPVVLFAVAAVVAIVAVNTHAPAVAVPATLPAALPAAPSTATEVRLDPVDCTDCGEVIAVRPAEDEDAGAAGQLQGGLLIDVRMNDGSVRTVKQLAPGFDVGDRVQVNGNALIARS